VTSSSSPLGALETSWLKCRFFEKNGSSYASVGVQLVGWRYDVLARRFTGSRFLELGSSDGHGTACCSITLPAVTAVDASAAATARLRELHSNPRLTAICSVLENLDIPLHLYTVVATQILEHVNDPASVLARV
jgi:SAM-dependent methyltransferase